MPTAVSVPAILPTAVSVPTFQLPPDNVTLEDSAKEPTKDFIPTQCPHHRLIPSGSKVIAFDTETSGWIKHDTESNLVLQMAWVICDSEGGVLKAHERYCQLPRGLPITGIALKVHKISMVTVRTHGTNTKAELEAFCDLVHAAKHSGVRVVAHNAAFDVQAINRTLRRWGSTRNLDIDGIFCTMRRSGAMLGLKGPSGRARNPKNSELYQILFKKEPEGVLHTAYADCLATAKNYIGGLGRGWWR
mgnify:CR=1 FL=1